MKKFVRNKEEFDALDMHYLDELPKTYPCVVSYYEVDYDPYPSYLALCDVIYLSDFLPNSLDSGSW